MKLHLPLSLLRSLVSGNKGIARTVAVIGALLAIPASQTTITYFASSFLQQGQELLSAQEQEQAQRDFATVELENDSDSDTARKQRDARMKEQELACLSLPRTLASITAANVAGTQSHGGGGAMLVAQPARPGKRSNKPRLHPLLITAGIAPLENYVAHGSPAPGGNTPATPISPGSKAAVAAAPAAPAPPATPLRARTMLRSMPILFAAAPKNAPTVTADEPWTGLTWTGKAGNAWDTASILNWKDAANKDCSFTPGSSALFTEGATNKAINVAASQNLTDMKVAESGYSFSGGGNITLSGTLTVAIHNEGKDANGQVLTGSLNFGAANNINAAGGIVLMSGIDTWTTFNGNVSTGGDLVFKNCTHEQSTGGHYIFNGAVSVDGKLQANLGTTGAAGAADKQLLSVNGTLKAASITLEGTSQKSFGGDLTTTSGGLTVLGLDTGALLPEGKTEFHGNVSLAGGLSIGNNGQATFGGGLTSTAEGGLQTTLSRGVLVYNGDTRLSETGAITLGTITLQDIGADDGTPLNNFGRLNVGSLAQVNATLNAHGNTFKVGGSSTAVNLTLAGSATGDFVVDGGVKLFLSSDGGSGRIGGLLTVTEGAELTLNSDDLIAATEGAAQGIIIDNKSTLRLGTITSIDEDTLNPVTSGIHMALRGPVTLNGSSREEDGGGAKLLGGTGSALTTTDDATINFNGFENEISTEIKLNEYTAPAMEGDTPLLSACNKLTLQGYGGGSLTITGDISGGNVTDVTKQTVVGVAANGSEITEEITAKQAEGELVFSGNGTTTLAGKLSFTGNVLLENGATVALRENDALANAHKVIVGADSTLTLNHDGSPAHLNGAGDWMVISTADNGVETGGHISLELQDGAEMSFRNLNGHEDTAALELQGGLLFNGDVTFRFGEDSGKQLDNLHTFELITSKSGVNQTQEGSVTVYANGKTTPLDSSQYAFGFYIDDENLRHFTFTILAGKSWRNGDGTWHTPLEEDPGEYLHWTTGDVGNAALFRTQQGDAEVFISLGEETLAEGLYMDGSTDYTITATDGMAGVEAFGAKDKETGQPLRPIFIKKGEASMTWNNLTGTLGTVEVDEGTLALTNASTLTATAPITIADVTYHVPEGGGLAVKTATAALAIDSTSALSSGGATIKGSGTTTNGVENLARLHGVLVNGATITPWHSGLSGTEEAPSGHYIENASITGFHLSGHSNEDSLQLKGSGSINDGSTIGNHVAIAEDANYNFSGTVVFDATVANSGTVSFDSAVRLGIGGLAQGIGQSNRYELFSNNDTGSCPDWTELNTTNFRLNGVNLDTLLTDKHGQTNYKVTISTPSDGVIEITSSGVAFVSWDNAWGIPVTMRPAIALDMGEKNVHVIAQTSGAAFKNFSYSERVSGSAEGVFVANIGDNVSDKHAKKNHLEGANGGGTYADPLEIWINSGEAVYLSYTGGSTSGTLFASTHLQVTGNLPNVSRIIGASYNATQYGDSYLTLTAGDYSNRANVIIAAGNYSTSQGANPHHGNSLLHIAGGSFGSVYGGSYGTSTTSNADYEAYNKNFNTHLIISGGTIVNAFGGDYLTATSNNTHDGNVIVDLKGGTLTNVYGAGGGSNTSIVTGDVDVNLYSTLDEATGLRSMSSKFTDNAQILGGAATATQSAFAEGSSSLNFIEEGAYVMDTVTLDRFHSFELTDDSSLTISADKFNLSSELTICLYKPTPDFVASPNGTREVHVVGSNTKGHNVTLEDRTRLFIETSAYSTERSTITVKDGSQVIVAGHPSSAEGSVNVELILAGDGTDGKGALCKSSGNIIGTEEFPKIELAANASIGVEKEATLHIAGKGTGSFVGAEDTEMNLGNFVLTKKGEGTLSLYNTHVTGGTLNVAGGMVETGYSSIAADTDLVLHEHTRLNLAANLIGNDPYTGEPSSRNGLAIESLNGEGDVYLNEDTWLYISMNQGRSEFAKGLDYSDVDGYGHFRGRILNESTGGTVSKSGGGTQYFCGSESTYSGGTTVEGGRLYLEGTSYSSTFGKQNTGASIGVIGTGALTWSGENAEVYLGDGVRIFNPGYAQTAGSRMDIGVEASIARDAEGNILRDDEGAVLSASWNEATYSGVLTSTQGMAKVGEGTLNVDQLGSFSGGTVIEGGTLNLYGWASASDATITQAVGTTIMFSHDASYDGEAAEETFNTPFALNGTGDVRWESAQRTSSRGYTAALISDIGAAKKLTLSGTLSDGENAGNLMHSGEGTLTLTGANEYSGGTTVMRGTLVSTNASALGATAEGGNANLVLAEAATISFKEADAITLTETTLAATATDIGGNATGNRILGVVNIGTVDPDTAQLRMRGDGYNASRTELSINDVLIFDGRASSNWDGLLNEAGTAPRTPGDMGGANILAGDVGSKLVVTDADTLYTQTDDAGKLMRTAVYFQVTDVLSSEVALEPLTDGTLPSVSGYKGDILVEGEQALLHIQGGAITGGTYEVSGTGAKLDAQRSIIEVNDGKAIALTSRGDEDADSDSTATLAAYRVLVKSGGTLAVSTAATAYQYRLATAKEQVQQLINLPLESALSAYPYNNYEDEDGNMVVNRDFNYSKVAGYVVDDEYLYKWNFDDRISLNTRTAGKLKTDSGLTLQGNSTYISNDSNTSLNRTKLVLDVTSGKIRLTGTGSYRANVGDTELTQMDMHEYFNLLRQVEGENDTTPHRQWVLFTDVSAFEVMNGSQTIISGISLAEAGYSSWKNQLYVLNANDVFEEFNPTATIAEGDESADDYNIPDRVLLVYDAGAEVVFLDRIPNKYLDPIVSPDLPAPIPEPTTATLSLLALTALAARRRRR